MTETIPTHYGSNGLLTRVLSSPTEDSRKSALFIAAWRRLMALLDAGLERSPLSPCPVTDELFAILRRKRGKEREEKIR